MAVKYLTDDNVDGWSMGQSATSKISFYGATPVVIPTLITTVAVTTTMTTAHPTAINSLITALRDLGLNASA